MRALELKLDILQNAPGRNDAWASVHAARASVSLSRFVGEVLRDRMREAREYKEAMRGFLAERPLRLKKPGNRYLTRDEAHDRTRLR